MNTLDVLSGRATFVYDSRTKTALNFAGPNRLHLFPLLGATQSTLRYDPISRLRPPDNFRFQYWPWQFPDKFACPAAFLNALQAKNFRFRPF